MLLDCRWCGICNHLLPMDYALRSANDVDDANDVDPREVVVEFPAVVFTRLYEQRYTGWSVHSRWFPGLDLVYTQYASHEVTTVDGLGWCRRPRCFTRIVVAHKKNPQATPEYQLTGDPVWLSNVVRLKQSLARVR